MTRSGVQSDLASGSSLPAGVPDSTSLGGSIRPFPSDAPLASPLASEAPPGGGLSGLLRTIKRRQGLFLLTSAVVTGAFALNTLRERIFSPVYEGGFQMQITNPLEEKSAASADNGSIESIARTTVKTDVPSLIVLLRSPLLVRPMAEKQGVNMAQVISGLSIKPTSQEVENVLNVYLRWGDAAKGRAILKELSKEYTRFSLTQRQAALDSAIKFLDRQGPEIVSRLNELNKELLRFRQENNFLDPSTTAASILSAREELVSQLRTLQNEQVQLTTQIETIKSGTLQFTPSGAPAAIDQLGREGVLTPGRGLGAEEAVGTPNPAQQLYGIEQELALARATYRENSPIVQSLIARRDRILPLERQKALDQARSKLLQNVAQQDEINRQILLLNQNFRTSPRKVSAFEDLNARVAAAREQYASYTAARERIRLELARSTTPWQVISPPEFGDIPVEPDIQRNLLRGLLFGLLAGVVAAILRERTDNVFHTPMEAEKELQLPVLGLIPYLPLEPGVEISASISKMSASERFAIKESLRSLFTTFRLLRADRDIRLVGVTSSTQGEGKSTAVTVFARTLADLGLRVLIVDADMRLPMQGRYLGTEQGEGLSSLLSNSNVQIEPLIQPIQDNLDMIPAGPKPPDPAKLLNSSRCQEVVDMVRALPGYDIVLWDAPPCLMLADPILLGEKLDGILFLVGLGKVSRDLAPQACRRIKATGVDVLGLICNQVNFPSRLNDYGYEYGYYYHYAYAGSYGGAKDQYGTYGRRIKSYIKGYGSTYVPGGSRYISDRYVQSSHDLSLGEEIHSSPEVDAGNTVSPTVENGVAKASVSRSGATSSLSSRLNPKNFLSGRLPFPGRRSASTKKSSEPPQPEKSQVESDSDDDVEPKQPND